MGQMLDDGTILPYGLETSLEPQFPVYDTTGVYMLLSGEIKDVVYPDSQDSRTKKFVEYSVFAQYRAGAVGIGKVFLGCVMINHLASLADFDYQTLRVNKKAGEDSQTKGLGKGSKVLFLCANGDTGSPIIIGGLPDPKDESQKDIPKDKRLSHWQFNGVHIDVNDDGEYQITFKGATDIDGKTDVKDSVAGSFAKWAKNGNISVQDNDGKNQVLIDHENKKVVVKRDEAFELGDATDKMLLGESFRKEQESLHQKLSKFIDTISQMTQNAGIAAATAGGKMVVPIYGAVLAASDIAQLGSLLVSIAQINGQMKQALDAFENAAKAKNSFLSKKNSAD